MRKEKLVEGEDILELIPQRAPIVMVDSFWGQEEDCSYTGLTISDNNIFLDQDYFSEPGIIEHIAQSAAVRMGYAYKQMNKPVPLGFIGSVDKMKIYRLPKSGDELYTEIKIIQEVFGITLIGASVKLNDEQIAECRMKIFLNKDE